MDRVCGECKSRDLNEPAHGKRGLMAFSVKIEVFADSDSRMFRKNFPENPHLSCFFTHLFYFPRTCIIFSLTCLFFTYLSYFFTHLSYFSITCLIF